MGAKLIKLKPTSPGRRHRIVVVHDNLHKGDPHSQLVCAKKRISGRNSSGRITVNRRGGGHKRLYRVIDFKRDKFGIPGRVERIEYDPNRTAHIALVLYQDGERRYIIAPKSIQVGDEILSDSQAPIKPGNCLPLSRIPQGTFVHCVELKPGKGAQLVRTAGASAQLVARQDVSATSDLGRNYVILRLRSGEMRRVLAVCLATIGEVSFSEHNLISYGKAGARRWLGRRPTVRGVAMNPVDHPHGGGEGKTSAGRHPVSPTGVPTKGYRTRRRKNKYMVRDRRADS